MRLSRIAKTTFWCVMAASIVSCSSREGDDGMEQEGVISVTTDVVSPVEANRSFVVSGNVEGMKTVNVGFLVPGKINETHGEEGSFIKEGELIASLDPTNYAIAKELADVQVNQASDEHGRLKLMYERKSISESDYMKSKFALDGALAQQRLRAKDLADTKLYAPISGVLLSKRAESGEIVSGGMPIVTIADISNVKVNAYIPEDRLKDIKIGQSVSISIDAVDYKKDGMITEVGGMADPTTRSFTVKALVDNPDFVIRPGMIAEVLFEEPGNEPVLAVRSTALLHTPDGRPYVYVADEEKNRAYRRELALGSLMGDYIEVISGLDAGETIIIGGKQKLANGSRISIQSE